MLPAGLKDYNIYNQVANTLNTIYILCRVIYATCPMTRAYHNTSPSEAMSL